LENESNTMSGDNGYVWLEKKKVPNGYMQIAANRIEFLLWLERTLGYQNAEDWYRITVADFQKNHGGSLLTTIYKGSPQKAVRELYPDIRWKPWQFTHVPNGWWKKTKNRREFVVDLQHELSIVNLDDWYHVPKQEYLNHGGRRLFNYLKGMIAILREVYPRHLWHEWLFIGGVTRGFFDNKSNRLRALKWLESKLGWRKPSDWYSISAVAFRSNKLGGLLNRNYNNSPILAAIELYPELEPHKNRFENVERNHWSQIENRRLAFEELGKELSIRRATDWYGVTQDQIRSMGTHSLISFYNGSVFGMVRELLPKETWLPWFFRSCPNGWWRKKKNRLEGLRYLGQKEGFDNPDDWYRVQVKHFRIHKLSGLLHSCYGNSPYAAVKELFPCHTFLEWKFICLPRNFWNFVKNRRRYVRWLGKELEFKCKDDWYGVTIDDFVSNYGWGMLHGYYRGSYKNALLEVFPHHHWDESRFVQKYRKEQKRIFHLLKNLLPDYKIEWEYSSNVRYPDTGRPSTFDIFIPKLRLAVEYHGTTHREPMPHINHSAEDVRNRQRKDEDRRRLCKMHGITLVEISDLDWYDARSNQCERTFLEEKIDDAYVSSASRFKNRNSPRIRLLNSDRADTYPRDSFL